MFGLDIPVEQMRRYGGTIRLRDETERSIQGARLAAGRGDRVAGLRARQESQVFTLLFTRAGTTPVTAAPSSEKTPAVSRRFAKRARQDSNL